MRRTPRTNALALTLATLCAAACAPYAQAAQKKNAPAQKPSPTQKPQTTRKSAAAPESKKAATSNTRASAARARRERRQAATLLLEVAGGAREIEDLRRRATVLAYCADALWDADEPGARTLFRRAWESAAEADESELKDEREQGRYGDIPERFTHSRDLVLGLAARRDARAAETFLRELSEWLGRNKSDEAGASENARGVENEAPEIGPLDDSTPDGQRLSLAFSLLDEDSHKSAVAVAEPAFARGPSGALIEFLLHLRPLAPEEADRLYLRLLASARSSPDSDANDVLLLSSYVLTPRLLAAVDERGSVQFRPIGDARGGQAEATAAVSVQVRAAFFDAAASILLRPTLNETAARAAYFTAGRLLPFFEREAARHAPAIHARMTALAAELDSARRDALDAQMRTQKLSGDNPSDPLRERLEALGRERDPQARDLLRLGAVSEASKRRMWDRARRLADEIEDEAVRRKARSVIAARQVAALSEAYADEEENAEDDEDFEKAAAFARDAEVSNALRAYGLAQAAELAARRGRRARSHALFDEAFAQALQTEAGTALRDAATMMTAAFASRVGSPRRWEALDEVVSSLNSDEDFTGDEIWFNLRPSAELSGEDPSLLNEVFHQFSLEEVFAPAAETDFARASSAARSLKNASARSLALIACAGAVIERSRPSAAPPAR